MIYHVSRQACVGRLQEDTQATSVGADAAERYGRSRLSNVADVVGGVLDPAEYLRKGRHTEWIEAMRGALAGKTALHLCSGQLSQRVRSASTVQNIRAWAPLGPIPASPV